MSIEDLTKCPDIAGAILDAEFMGADKCLADFFERINREYDNNDSLDMHIKTADWNTRDFRVNLMVLRSACWRIRSEYYNTPPVMGEDSEYEVVYKAFSESVDKIKIAAAWVQSYVEHEKITYSIKQKEAEIEQLCLKREELRKIIEALPPLDI